MVMENRSAWSAAREAHPQGWAAASTHVPRSQPTAHRPLIQGEDPDDAVIRRSREAFGAAARTLRAFLLAHRPPPQYLDALEQRVVVPTYGDAGGMRTLIASVRTRDSAVPTAAS
jgi:hypothetical protein